MQIDLQRRKKGGRDERIKKTRAIKNPERKNITKKWDVEEG